MHAAGDATRRWWGTDVMPTHARHAEGLLQAAGVDGVAADQSFAEFCARDDLPRFAFVGLHGVWSWVSPANRALIVDFLRRRLLPGGVVYLSFNTVAGWATHLPVRQLLVEHARLAGAPGATPAAQADAARSFVRTLLALDGSLVREAPLLRQHLGKDAEQAAEYILHEYMNRDWHLSTVAEVAQQLEAAQVGWACPTDLTRRLTNLFLKPEHQALLAEIASPLLRETVADTVTGQRLRRDLWVRGARRLVPQEQRERLLDMHVVLAGHATRLGEPIVGPFGEARLPPERVALLTEALRALPGAVRLRDLAATLGARGMPVSETLALVSALVGKQALAPAHAPEDVARARPATDRLNAALLERALLRGDMNSLASPVTGGGVLVSAAQQRLLLARRSAPDRPAEWAAIAWQQLQQHGLALHKDGRAVTAREEALPLLQRQVDEVRDQTVPLLQRLQVLG
jgi:hypothetical protein